MNRKVIALAMVVIAMATVISPFMMESSEAFVENKGGIVVSTVEDGDVSISIDSGKTGTITLYIANTTSNPVAVSVDKDGFDGDIATNVSYPNILTAVGDSASVGVITAAFTVNNYADNHNTEGHILITVRDTTGTAPYVFSVPVKIEVESVYSHDDAYNKFFGIFPNTLGSPLNEPWMTAVITFVIWIVATIIVSEIVIPLFTRFTGNRTTKDEKKSIRDHLTLTITSLMIVIAINECTQIIGLDPEITYFIQGISTILYVILCAVIAWQIYLFVVTAFLKGLDEKADVDGMDMSLLPLFKMIGKLVIGVLGVCIALSAFGVDLAGIMVSAGVVTLGITLGAQNTLNQFFSGIVLLATRPFKRDDFVRIGNVEYIVRKVKLMYTEFYNWDVDQVVTIPNNVVSSSTIINLTGDYHRTRVYAYVDVAYDSDIELVKECLVSAGKKHPHVIQDGSCSEPGARLTNFGASGLTFRLACYVDDFDNSSHYTGQLRELILEEFRDKGIEIPYNRIQIDILSKPENMDSN